MAATAKAITAEAWEILSSNDEFHRTWPNVNRFVAKQWKNFLGHARASLLVLLQPIPGTEKDPDGPKYTCHQLLRDEIYEAFLAEGGFKHVPQPRSPYASELARHMRFN